MGRSIARTRKSRFSKTVQAQRFRRMKEKGLAEWFEVIDLTGDIPRQKELAALLEASTSTDGGQTTPGVVDDPVNSVLQDVIAQVAQDIDPLSVVSTSYDVQQNAATETASEYSNVSQTASSINQSTVQIASKYNPSSFPILYTPGIQKHLIGTQNFSGVLKVRNVYISKGVQTNKLKTSLRSVGIQNNYDAEKILKTRKNAKGEIHRMLPRNGRRIVNIEHFFDAMQRMNKHSRFGCNLDDIVMMKESRSGIRTSYHLKCRRCLYTKMLKTDNIYKWGDINVDFIKIMLSLNCDFDDMNKVLTRLHLPTFSPEFFVKQLRKISPDEMAEISDSLVTSCKNMQPKEKVQEILETAIFQASTTLETAKRKTSENLHRNTEDEPQSVTGVTCPLGKKEYFQPNNSGRLEDQYEDLLEDQFEVKGENAVEDEPEFITPDEITEQPPGNELVVDQEQTEVLNLATIKQEIDLDSVNETSITQERETLNEKSPHEHISQSTAALFQQKEVRTCENRMVVNQNKSHETAGIHNMEAIDKERVIDSDISVSGARLPPLKKARTVVSDCEVVHNQNLAKFGEKEAEQKVCLVESNKERTMNVSSYETESERATNDDHQMKTVHENSSKSLYGTELYHSADRVAISAAATARGMENMYAVPLQHMPESNGNRAVFHPHIPPNLTSGTYQGVNRPTFAPGTSTILQQHHNETSGLLPLVRMHSSWFSNPSAVSSNQLIIVPSVSGPTYTSMMPTAICQPPSFSNSGGLTYVSSIPTTVQQPVNFSNNGQPSTANNPRWIGPGNMSSNSPYTLPGGTLKGVSDPVPKKPSEDQSNPSSKRPRFRCDDCDIDFVKHSSWDSHKKSFCIKRFKLPTSSTATSHMLINNDVLEPPHMNRINQVTHSFKPHLEELFSAMAVKRSLLEASMETALAAQYVINLHKSAQDLTKKTIEELDDAVNKEKALTPKTSLEEQKIIYEAKIQAVARAEAAYMQEKYSEAAVEQALCRQKSAIEATVTASRQEQTALISAMKGLKVQANQNCESPDFLTQHNLPHKTSVNLGKLTNVSLTEIKKQQQFHNISLRSIPVHKAPLDSSEGFSEQRDETNVTSHTDVQQNVSHIDIHPEKLNTKIQTESNIAAVTQTTFQPKETDAAISDSNCDSSILENLKTMLTSDFLHPL